MKNYANILSIDGGGIRGILELVQLVELEKELDCSIIEKFQYITGTSTGAIIAILLSIGMSAQSILDLYIENAHNIFKKRWFKFGLFSYKYDDTFLNKLLEKYTGTKTLIDTNTQVLIPTYNITKHEKYLFKSKKADENENENFLLKDVIRSSAGAPLFFKNYRIHDDHYIDGGIIVNNPTLMMLIEVIKLNYKYAYNYDKINILSFSGGQKINNYTYKKLNGGLLLAGKVLTKIMLDEQAKLTHYITSQLYEIFKVMLNNNFGKYTRCQSYMHKSSGKIDDASKKNINFLIEDGLLSYKYNRKKIINFIKYIK